MTLATLNPALLAAAALALAFLSLLAALLLFLKVRAFTRGKKGADLEDTLRELLARERASDAFEQDMREYLGDVERRLKRAIQGVATVRFNPFKGTGDGGRQSFATAFLSEEGNGVVISTLFSRDRTSVFAKPVHKNDSSFELSGEEKRALEETRKSIAHR